MKSNRDRNMRFHVLDFVGILLLSLLVSGTADAGPKKIAVIDFDDKAVVNQMAHADNPMAMMMALSGRQIQQQNPNIGASVASILTTELVKDGTYKVIERSQLESILKEQNLSMSGVTDIKTAAKIGQVLGVSALITGTVTEYNVATKSTGVLGVGAKTTIGKVSLNARMIDASSGEILFAADGAGEEQQTGVAVGGLYQTGSSNYGNTLLGKATVKALENIKNQVTAFAPNLKDILISGMVAHYDNVSKSCYLDLGKESGVEKDQTLYVTRVVHEVKSPTTGEVIKQICDRVAEVKIQQVEKLSSTAVCVSGKCEDIRAKDRVSSVPN